MLIAPLIAATLTINFHGLSVITPWKAPSEAAPRVWVFYPDTEGRNVPRHFTKLSLPRSAVLPADWNPNSTAQNGDGVWNLDGYVLSVHRDGITDAPDRLLTWGPGKEAQLWQGLRFLLDLTRVVPAAHIIDRPFGKSGAVAAVKLADGDLDAELPDRRLDVWEVTPATPRYIQPFTDLVTYRVDAKNAATELRFEPVPGGSQPPKRIRLVLGANANVVATVTHLPNAKGRPADHAHAASGLFAEQSSRDRVSTMAVRRTTDMGGDPLCDSLIFQLKPMPSSPPGCIRCAIDLRPAIPSSR